MPCIPPLGWKAFRPDATFSCMVAQPQLQSTLTCPLCGHQATEIVLFLYGLRRDTEAASRKLLCFLFVRLGAVSAHSRGCRTPLYSEARPKPQRLGWKHTHEFVGVVAPQCHHRCWPICADPSADGYLDRSTRLDGHSLRLKCPAVWSHSLPLYRPVLFGDDLRRRPRHRPA
jgi:hypothetical protein